MLDVSPTRCCHVKTEAQSRLEKTCVSITPTINNVGRDINVTPVV
jgi:hypothetical protein